MSTIHRYLTREIVAVLVVALLVFIAILLLGNAFKEVLALLVSRQVSIGTVARVLFLQVPWLLSFALPLGFLTSILLVYGRLSADQEVVALRAGGVSLASASWPVVGLAIVCCLISLVINTDLAPSCRIKSKSIAGDLIRSPVDLIVSGRYVRDFPGWTIFIGGKSGETLSDVLLYGYEAETGRLTQRIEAGSGSVAMDQGSGALVFNLVDATFFFRGSGTAEGEGEYGVGEWETLKIGRTTQRVPLAKMGERSVVPDLSEMTRSQLRDEWTRVEREGLPVGPVRFHLHRQLASSFACFAFVLVGIPLGIRAHRRETSVGLALALLVAVAYYAFVTLAQSLEVKEAAMPHLLVWAPNFVFAGIGGWLMWRANRGLA